MSPVRLIELTEDTLAAHKICGQQGSKHEGYQRKLAWCKARFAEGLRYTVLHSDDDGDVGGIEYIDGENNWRALYAPDYFVIHCIYIMKKEYKSAGYGSMLVEACIADAQAAGKSGVAVVTSKKTFLAGSQVFKKCGFSRIDTAPPHFELWAYTCKADAAPPAFMHDWHTRQAAYGKGLTIVRSDQCNYTVKNVAEIIDAAKKMGLTANIVDVVSAQQAQQHGPSAYGCFGILHDGQLIADHPISKRRFENIMGKRSPR